jgi:hypothetical protein
LREGATAGATPLGERRTRFTCFRKARSSLPLREGATADRQDIRDRLGRSSRPPTSCPGSRVRSFPFGKARPSARGFPFGEPFTDVLPGQARSFLPFRESTTIDARLPFRETGRQFRARSSTFVPSLSGRCERQYTAPGGATRRGSRDSGRHVHSFPFGEVRSRTAKTSA